MKELYTELIEEVDFHRAWANAIAMVLANGTDLVIGGAEQRKPIKDSCMLISLEGNAIRQIEAKEIHPQFPTKRNHLDKYCEEYTREYLNEYNRKKKEEKFTYLYFERLVSYKGYYAYVSTNRKIDQIMDLRSKLHKQIENGLTSNRDQAITWDVGEDSWSVSPPCLQRIQIRYIPENKVDVHLTWRSRDLLHAWQSNIICIIQMLNREVIKPNNCQITRIVDFSDSLHIYKTDIGEAKKVNLILL